MKKSILFLSMLSIVMLGCKGIQQEEELPKELEPDVPQPEQTLKANALPDSMVSYMARTVAEDGRIGSIIYKYDAQGHVVTEDRFGGIDGVDRYGTGCKHAIYNYEYNQAGMKTREEWMEAENRANYLRELWEYDAKGNMLKYSNMNGCNSEENGTAQLWTYNSDGQKISYIHQMYVNKAFQNESREIYEYENGKLTKKYSSYWDRNENAWGSASCCTYFYDLETGFVLRYEQGGEGMAPNSRCMYTTDGLGRITKASYQDYDNGDWVEKRREEFEYAQDTLVSKYTKYDTNEQNLLYCQSIENFEYDALNHIVRRTFLSGPNSKNEAGSGEEYRYDGENKVYEAFLDYTDGVWQKSFYTEWTYEKDHVKTVSHYALWEGKMNLNEKEEYQYDKEYNLLGILGYWDHDGEMTVQTKSVYYYSNKYKNY